MNTSPSFHPVIIGSDIGIYGLARCFYEAYGLRSSVLARSISPQIRNSKIVEIYLQDKFDPTSSDYRELADKLLEIAPQIRARHPEADKLLLITNADSYISAIAQHQARLAQEYVIATAPQRILEQTSNKADFARLCEKFQISTPPTTIINFDQPEDVQAVKQQCPYQFPVVLKPAVSKGYELLSWSGKAKVYFIDSQAQLQEILENLDRETARFQVGREFVLQPRIGGNDTYNLSLTAYVDSHGEVTMLSSAHVLLEEHQPNFLGNPAAMIVENYPGLYEQAVRFLQGVNWFGFANFDIKVDPDSHTPYFFEVNPRIGRNCYYNAIAGINPATFVVGDLIEQRRITPQTVQEHAFYCVLPLNIVRRYLDKTLWRQVQYLRRSGKAANPMLPKYERAFTWAYFQRWLGLQRYIQRHQKHFPRNYPKKKFLAQSPRCFHTDQLRRPR